MLAFRFTLLEYCLQTTSVIQQSPLESRAFAVRFGSEGFTALYGLWGVELKRQI